jgi:hypothetical protein
MSAESDSELRVTRPLATSELPYRCERRSLELSINEFSLDGTGSVEPESDGRINLEEWDSWSTVDLEVSIDVSEDVVERVFAPWEYDGPPAELVLAVRCRDTYLRERYVIEDNPVLPDTHEKTITLDHDRLHDRVELHAYLVRATDIDDAPGNIATEAGLYLADSESWTISIDEPEEGTTNLLPAVPKSFSEAREEGETRFPPEDRLYYLDFENDRSDPTLWINEDHSLIKRVLDSDSRQYDRKTQELIWNQIMTPAWTRFITVAASEFDGDDPEWDYDWQAGVFRRVHDLLYEDSEPIEAATTLQEALSESSYEATRRIEDAVQELLEPAKYFNDHIESRRDA